MGLQIIISGGQTGVDRGALDACLEMEFPCGGWCTAGRAAEDGPIPLRYPMIELRSPYYDDRTRRNIVESDATLIIPNGKLNGGTLLTANYSRQIGKPVFIFEIAPFFIDQTMENLIDFLIAYQVETLNVAGPRASLWSKAHETSQRIIKQLLELI